MRGVHDTMVASRQRHPDALEGHSLKAVCERELNISLDKSQQTSDWAQRPLTLEQLEYAALDAEVLLLLHNLSFR